MSSSSSSSSTRPIRILCLHGFSQNADIFRQRTGALRTLLKSSTYNVSFDYVNAPIELTEIEEYSSLPNNEVITADRYTWWRRHKDDPEYHNYIGFDRCIDTVKKQWYSCMQHHQCHGYDGILGFSQGAGLCAILAALHQYWYITQKQKSQNIKLEDIVGKNSPHLATLTNDNDNLSWLASLKFTMIFSGFVAKDITLSKLFNDQRLLPFTSTYSLHVYGTDDELVSSERCIFLSKRWDDAHRQVHKHTGGHVIPTKRYDLETYKDFILGQRGHLEENDKEMEQIFQKNMQKASEADSKWVQLISKRLGSWKISGKEDEQSKEEGEAGEEQQPQSSSSSASSGTSTAQPAKQRGRSIDEADPGASEEVKNQVG